MKKIKNFLLVLSLLTHIIHGTIFVPRLNGLCYYNLGDLNIALLQEISDDRVTGEFCADYLASEWKPQYVESFKFAIEEINRNNQILPNVTLGYVVMDICNRDLVALSRSLSFIMGKGHQPEKSYSRTDVGKVIACDEEIVHFDVVGIVGPDTSREAVMVSSLMSLFEIPVLSTYASSDELTDKRRFEYFMRLVPPDRFQAQAMMEIVEHYNWTYISLLYSEGSYGENGAKMIEREAKDSGICIEYVKKVPQENDREAYDHIIDNLLNVYKARVVVLFIDEIQGPLLFEALNRKNIKDYFIWIAADAIFDMEFGPAANGMFSMLYTMGMFDTFENYYRYLVPSNSSGNPWMPKLWELYYNCKWDNVTVPCEEYEFIPNVDHEVTTWASKQYDGAWVYAQAIHTLIEDKCSYAFQNISLLDDCINGKDLLSYMKNVSFEGMSGKIKFDESGDMIGEYSIFQYVYNYSSKSSHNVAIGKWDKSTEEMHVNEDKLLWHIFLTGPEAHTKVSGIPESICSKPCKDTEYAIQKELKCCWECMRCRENEIIVNKSGCAVCPENTWPNEADITKCEKITPAFLSIKDTIPIALLTIGLIGIFGQTALAVIFYKHKDTKLIKASGRELTSIIWIGIFIAYITVLAFVSRPTTVLCHLSHTGFNVSVTLIYAPLLLKTNRIYRIFTNGKKGTKSMRFTGSSSQLFLTSVLFIIQVRIVAKCY